MLASYGRLPLRLIACTVSCSVFATGGIARAQNSTPPPDGAEAIVVTGQREGYTPMDTSAAKIPAALRDIPQSIAVVPSQVLLDQRALSL